MRITSLLCLPSANTLTGTSKTLAGPASVFEVDAELTDFDVVFLVDDELVELSLEVDELDVAETEVPSTVNIAASA